MLVRKKLLDKILKKQEEISKMEKELGESRAYLMALQDMLKLLPRAESAGLPQSAGLRAGTDLAKAYDVLKKAGEPLPMTELLTRMGKEVNAKNRMSLSGSLGSYVRKNSIFSRPAPNTFGLIEFDFAT